MYSLDVERSVNLGNRMRLWYNSTVYLFTYTRDTPTAEDINLELVSLQM
jgi:hypothetical protein